MLVAMGSRELELGTAQLGEMRDANDVLADPEGLRARMDEDGYLLVRGLHERHVVLEARRAILEHLDARELLAPGSEILDGIVRQDAEDTGVNLMGSSGIVQHEAVRRVLEGPPVFELFERLLGAPALTFSYKWLRAVGPAEFTGVHLDAVYMGRGSPNVFTCWVPFGDVPVEQGSLAVCAGSHRSESFRQLRQTYGSLDVDRDDVGGSGWFTTDPLEVTQKFGGTWRTTDFRAGDVIVFGMHTVHASTNNTSDRYRISCDTRFQPANEPVDERWAGPDPSGHYRFGRGEDEKISMEEAKARWGV